MTAAITRIRIGLTVLALIVVLATAGYHYGGGYGWVEALWMVVVTISTVGYSESSTLPPSMQLFTVGVILVGIFAASFTFAGLLQVLVEGEIQQRWDDAG